MPGKADSPREEIRSFIAIEISDDVRRALDNFIRELKSGGNNVKWVRVEGIHLTLKFLGNIPGSMISEIKDAMERAIDKEEPFDIQVEGSGAFPNLRKPRVFWAGIKEETGRLADLAQRLQDELKSLGFEPENRAFRPHLTVGRVRQGEKAAGAAGKISEMKDKSFGTFRADKLILFKSDLKPGGAVYTRMEEIPFNKGNNE